MAFSNPEVYLKELAGPLLRRFQAEPDSYDLAVAVCIILYHFADVVGFVRQQTGPAIADELAEQIPYFDLIRALANAGKHVELTRHPNHSLLGLKAEHLVREIHAPNILEANRDCVSGVQSPRPSIMVVMPDGMKHDVLYLCCSVFASLEAKSEYLQV